MTDIFEGNSGIGTCTFLQDFATTWMLLKIVGYVVN